MLVTDELNEYSEDRLLILNFRLDLIHVILILSVLVCINAAGNSDKPDSDVYIQWKSGTFTQTMYLPDTFGGDFDPCQTIETRNDYLKILKESIIYQQLVRL